MWKYFAGRGRPQMTIWRMRIACWIPKAKNTQTGCAILNAFPLQQWLHERASVLRYTCRLFPRVFPKGDMLKRIFQLRVLDAL
jgi:hypothetical protein